MRDGLDRGGQSLRDGAAHAVVWNDLVAALFIERADLLIRHGRSYCATAGGRHRSRNAQSSAGFRVSDIAGDHTAMRAGALHLVEVNTDVFRESASQRR